MNTKRTWLAFPILLLAAALWPHVSTAADDDGEKSLVAPAKYVIHISVDGLRADAITRQSEKDLPNFYRFRTEGTYTDNARTDYYRSNTLPNHTTQLTGRPVLGPNGHNWTKNSDPEPGQTLHTNKGSYVASVFDVAHDNGYSTALYTSKSKFVVFDQSYNEVNGAADVTGADNGRDKIDRFVVEGDTEKLVERFVRDMTKSPYQSSLLHLRDPDHAGHLCDWAFGSHNAYMRAVRHVDELLGRVFELIETSPTLAGNTVVVLTADHGGGGSWHGHGDADHVENYTIPFYVWGRGVEHAEMYSLNHMSRRHPQTTRPGYDASVQPIRNGDAANLALSHLGLPAIAGSTINFAQGLNSGTMPSAGFHLADVSVGVRSEARSETSASAPSGSARTRDAGVGGAR